MSKSLTPVLCRAGRALLDWSQPQLSEAAGLGLSTVVDFERSRRKVSDEVIDALKRALEAAGVVFLADGDVAAGGPGVRLKPS
jgi:transcriptional regulator with XRE-family HTH domain